MKTHLRTILSSAALTAALAVPAAAQACANCSCGDPTLTSLGYEQPFKNRGRAASLVRYWGDELHLHENGGHSHAQLRELRMDLGGSFSPTDRLTLSLSAPVHMREYSGASWAGSYTGTGDVELGTRYVLFRDRDFQARHLVSVVGGARVPTAMQLRSGGELLPEDAQLSSNTFELRAGAAYSFFANPWSTHVTVLGGAVTDRAESEFDNVRWSGMAQRQFGTHVAVQAGTEGVLNGHDGLRLYGAAGVVVSPVTDVTLQLGARVPLEPSNDDRLGGSIGMLSAVFDF